MIELLAPAGNEEKLKTALYFGADAVYLSGKKMGLRAFADNFDEDGLKRAVGLVHGMNKKVYVTVNILAKNGDFAELKDYLKYLDEIGVDAVIVSDLGILCEVKKHTKLGVHISTQASITNKYSAKFYESIGANRLVMARELTLGEIKEIREHLDDKTEIEAFVHGAMCISYSGRCLLSDFMAGRHSNRGECAQSCRWEYVLSEKTRNGEYYPIQEDERGTYILNSKDMNMLPYVRELDEAGISSFKIEGRVKSSYYVAGVVNAYRRAINSYFEQGKNFVCPQNLIDDLGKISHRKYCNGFYFGKAEQCFDTSKPKQEYDFVALVTDKVQGGVIAEQRNRLRVGDEVEVLSPRESDGKKFVISEMKNSAGEQIDDAFVVQEKIFIKTDLSLSPNDILRKKSAVLLK